MLRWTPLLLVAASCARSASDASACPQELRGSLLVCQVHEERWLGPIGYCDVSVVSVDTHRLSRYHGFGLRDHMDELSATTDTPGCVSSPP